MKNDGYFHAVSNSEKIEKPKCLSIEEQLNKTYLNHMMKYCRDIEKSDSINKQMIDTDNLKNLSDVKMIYVLY